MFRSKGTVMSDQDLDAVLERGAKKTKEMQSKLNVAEKGDMLDFSFDDGTGVQVQSSTGNNQHPRYVVCMYARSVCCRL